MLNIATQEILHVLRPDIGGIRLRDVIGIFGTVLPIAFDLCPVIALFSHDFHLAWMSIVPPMAGQPARFKAHPQQKVRLGVDIQHRLQARADGAEVELAEVAGLRARPFGAAGIDRIQMDAELAELARDGLRGRAVFAI